MSRKVSSALRVRESYLRVLSKEAPFLMSLWKRSCWQICERWIRSKTWSSQLGQTVILRNYFKSRKGLKFLFGKLEQVFIHQVKYGYGMCVCACVGACVGLHVCMGVPVCACECACVRVCVCRSFHCRNGTYDKNKPFFLKLLLPRFMLLKSNVFLTNKIQETTYIIEGKRRINMIIIIGIEKLLD